MGMYMTRFLGCCPLELAVKNIASYYILLALCDLMFWKTSIHEEVDSIPSKYKFFYIDKCTMLPAKCDIATEYLEVLEILVMLTAILAFASTIVHIPPLLFPFVVTTFLLAFSRLCIVSCGVFALMRGGSYFVPMLVGIINLLLFFWEFYIYLAVYSYFEYSREFYE